MSSGISKFLVVMDDVPAFDMRHIVASDKPSGETDRQLRGMESARAISEACQSLETWQVFKPGRKT